MKKKSKQSLEKETLTDRQIKILKSLLKHDSYPMKMEKDLDLGASSISKDLKYLHGEYDGLLEIADKQLPVSEQKFKKTTKYYKVINRKLAEKLIANSLSKETKLA